MNLNNATTGQLERLRLLGCSVVIRDGKPHASIIGLALAAVNAVPLVQPRLTGAPSTQEERIYVLFNRSRAGAAVRRHEWGGQP